MGKTLLRPIDSASIDEKTYLKTVSESPKQSVASLVKDYLFYLYVFMRYFTVISRAIVQIFKCLLYT